MDALTSMVVMMMFAMTIGFVIMLIWWSKDKNKIKVLNFESPHQAKVYTRSINDAGLVLIGKKAFSMLAKGSENIKPVMLKTFWGWKPFYRTDYNSNILIPFHKSEESKITPQAIKILGELTTLEKIATQIKTPFLIWLMVIGCGIAIGAVLLYMLILTGAISIGPSTPSIPLPPIQNIG